ncbi:MarR family winged helix-turn-helix transcriptional regulator [Actinomadura sp. HBU206391]|uniref:MarR family winged helix-turn-helix transcriptional regulator n=1 Tax=Actinomadura sp. HBU206391 TaxID=2731692 RepID=UPI001650093B|nr:MarR family transcriptional regulator [Actinomadura sp. HBU206391]MBC6456942.1 MarR family transcriptional regulator [Actinomadura sp. HBU206391]
MSEARVAAGTGGRAGQHADEHAGQRVDEHEAYCAVEQQLGVLLRRARAFSAEMGREVHPELEPGAYSLLIRIDEVGPARSSDLAEYFGVGKATISRQLKVLEELGLIEREPDPADGRAHLLVLTGEGRQRLGHARVARQERFRAMLGTWELGDVEQLARMLGRFNALTDSWAEPGRERGRG